MSQSQWLKDSAPTQWPRNKAILWVLIFSGFKLLVVVLLYFVIMCSFSLQVPKGCNAQGAILKIK